MSVLGEANQSNTVLLTDLGTNIDTGAEIWMLILGHTWTSNPWTGGCEHFSSSLVIFWMSFVLQFLALQASVGEKSFTSAIRLDRSIFSLENKDRFSTLGALTADTTPHCVCLCVRVCVCGSSLDSSSSLPRFNVLVTREKTSDMLD